MNAKKQYGKGLSGFFVGLLLATAVIAGVLFFLNKNGKSSLKELPKPAEQASGPEILVPSQSSGTPQIEPQTPPAASSAGSSTAQTGVEPPVSSGTAAVEPGQTVTDSMPAKPEPAPVEDGGVTGHTEHPQVIAAPPKQQTDTARAAREAQKQAQAKKQAEKKAEAERAKKREQAKADVKSQEPKKALTPEEILNGGRIDKARKDTQNDAKKQSADDAERKRAEDALSGRSGNTDREDSKPSSGAAAKSENSAARGGKVVLQVGSYNNRQAADSQRSKLAMAGISAGVVEADVNGKPVYRVQTGVLSSGEAAAARKKLQQRGIQSFARSVK